jgi:hypothetical protein
LTGSIIIEARSPGSTTRLRPAWCLPRQAGFSFGNKRSWLELAYRVVPTSCGLHSLALSPPTSPPGQAVLGGSAQWISQQKIRSDNELWEQSHRKGRLSPRKTSHHMRTSISAVGQSRGRRALEIRSTTRRLENFASDRVSRALAKASRSSQQRSLQAGDKRRSAAASMSAVVARPKRFSPR